MLQQGEHVLAAGVEQVTGLSDGNRAFRSMNCSTCRTSSAYVSASNSTSSLTRTSRPCSTRAASLADQAAASRGGRGSGLRLKLAHQPVDSGLLRG